MRLIPIGGKRVQIEFANDQEARRWQKEEANMRRLMPNLMKLWKMEPRLLVTKKDFLELMKVGGLIGEFSVSDAGWLDEARQLVLAQVESERKAGRPVNQRTLVAAMRLLMFAPPRKVLAMEKEWQEKACMAKVRDQCVAREVKKARSKAVKDAENCVARAQKMVAKARSDYLGKYPESAPFFLVADKVVSDVVAESEQDGAGST